MVLATRCRAGDPGGLLGGGVHGLHIPLAAAQGLTRANPGLRGDVTVHSALSGYALGGGVWGSLKANGVRLCK